MNEKENSKSVMKKVNDFNKYVKESKEFSKLKRAYKKGVYHIKRISVSKPFLNFDNLFDDIRIFLIKFQYTCKNLLDYYKHFILNTDILFNNFKKEMMIKFIKKEKDFSNSWKNCNFNNLIELLNQHVFKFLINFSYGNYKMKDDLIDIANYCLMIYSRIKIIDFRKNKKDDKFC